MSRHQDGCSGPGEGCTLDDPFEPADICRERGWTVGTRLAGYEGDRLTTITITAIGQEQVLAEESDGHESSWVLDCRCWRAVDAGPEHDEVTEAHRALDEAGIEREAPVSCDPTNDETEPLSLASRIRNLAFDHDDLREELRKSHQVAEARRQQLVAQQASNERRNRQLDALHLVWCDGGCEGGVHRWTDAEVTEELVAEAERNTKRLRSWWENRKARNARTEES